MSVISTSHANRHYDALLSVRAEIAAMQVFEHAAEASHDEPRRAALDAHERDLWDALVHLAELG